MQPEESYEVAVAVVGIGGTGSNNSKMLIKGMKPEDQPGVYYMAANTDRKVRDNHFPEDDPCIAALVEAGKLTLHDIGGKDVTRGRGAGANPEIGRKAALTEYTKKAFLDLYKKVDEVILHGSLVGGTGGGGMAVAAQYALDAGKTVVALAVLPQAFEHRNRRAQAGLKELQALVPTIPIRNSYIEKYLEDLKDENLKRNLTPLQAWEIINNYSLVPMIRILCGILQIAGDVKNLDQADWKALLNHGKHLFMGLWEGKKADLVDVTAKEIVDALCIGRCQNPALLDYCKAFAVFINGPLSLQVKNDIITMVGECVGVKSGLDPDDIEVHWGMRQETTGDDIWVALIAVAENDGSEVASEVRKPIYLPVSQREGQRRVLTPLLIDGVEREIGIWPDQRDRYNAYWSDATSPLVEVERLRDEIREATGYSIDPPSWLKEGTPTTKVSSDDSQRKVH